MNPNLLLSAAACQILLQVMAGSSATHILSVQYVDILKYMHEFPGSLFCCIIIHTYREPCSLTGCKVHISIESSIQH